MIIQYSPLRNIWRSCGEYLESQVETEGRTDVAVVVSWQDAYEESNKEKNVIAVGLEDGSPTRLEVGSNELVSDELILIDIFGISEGDKLDLTHWIREKLKGGFPYVEYTVDAPSYDELMHAEVVSSTVNGKVENRRFISDRNVRLGAEADDRDKYRRAVAILVRINN